MVKGDPEIGWIPIGSELLGQRAHRGYASEEDVKGEETDAEDEDAERRIDADYVKNEEEKEHRLVKKRR